jgi:hypothetical protein
VLQPILSLLPRPIGLQTPLSRGFMPGTNIHGTHGCFEQLQVSLDRSRNAG